MIGNSGQRRLVDQRNREQDGQADDEIRGAFWSPQHHPEAFTPALPSV